MKKLIVIAISLVTVSAISFSQSVKRALFLGNSYTYVNDLPQLITSIANSTGDTLITDSYAPGGYSLQAHSTNSTSLNKIMLDNWDFVVLQEQSQLPSFPISQVETEVFPYARTLDSMINVYNDCCETLFYMTWGRKNGDASNCSNWPPVCTYAGMDSLLYERYMTMTYDNNAIVSPVGQVWKYTRQHYPSIELYQPDNSHPAAAGTYAAACCFYTVIFKKDPTNISFNSVLTAVDAANIRSAVKAVVFDSLMKWQVGKFDPVADFSFTLSGTSEVNFDNLSGNTANYLWDFGDGTTSMDTNPVHSYLTNGNYHVTLTAGNDCNVVDTISKQVSINAIDTAQQPGIRFYPNPVNNYLYIELPITAIRNILITNCIGQKHYPAYYAAGDRTKINFTMLPTGVYFVSIVTGKEKITTKIIRH